MSNIFKSNLVIKMEGASHTPLMRITVDGFPKGVYVDCEVINHDLAKRRPSANLSNARKENDNYRFLEGISNGYTNGGKLVIEIDNTNFNSDNYQKGIIRPSHVDYPAYVKYGETYDYRGGGQFSGRLMALIVILGALCKGELVNKGVKIASHIKRIGEVSDDKANYSDEEIEKLNNDLTINDQALKKMQSLIKEAKENKDSLGGIIEAYAKGVKVGLGEDYFGGLDAKISSLMFSIPGVKEVLFGNEDALNGYGSNYNDQLAYQDDKVVFLSNNAGGINGGLANGMPVIVNVGFRPTASIGKCQKSINIISKENIDLCISGNHDACFAYRCGVIVEGMLAIALLDTYLGEAK